MGRNEHIDKTITSRLACPVCSMPLDRVGGSLVCESRHTYDIARTGYVNLVNTSSQRESGDSEECVRARSIFLGSGGYAEFSRAVCRAAGEGEVCVDAGCGEGYYTTALARSFSLTYGFDLSRASIIAAAKRARAEGVAERTFFGVGSVYSLPMQSGCADVITNIFAPCVEEEYKRVLRDSGRLVVACAGEEHLSGLKSALYDEVRVNTERRDLPASMTIVSCEKVRYELTLDTPELIRALYMMTPYAYRTSREAEARLFSLRRLTTLVDFDILVYKK